jgi:hypothetical protein
MLASRRACSRFTDALGRVYGWHIYNNGVVVTLVVHPIEGPFERGAPYVWCKATRDVMGDTHPTAPLFGRFIGHTSRGPKVLSRPGKSAVLGAEYAYCFRAVGRIGFGSEFFPSSFAI